MFRNSLVVLCLVGGVGMVVAGIAWKHLVPAGSYWSADQAGEYIEATRALKAAAMREDRRADDPPDSQLTAAQTRFDDIKSDLDRAIAARKYSGTLLAIGGVVLVVVAVWLHQSRRTSE